MFRRRPALIAALLVAAAATLPATSRAQAESTVATSAPPAAHQVRAAGPTPRGYACAPVVAIACGVVGGAVDVVGDVAGGIVGTVGDGVLDGVSKWVGDGAAWIIGRIAGLVERSTRPELGATWFTDQYGRMLSLGLLLALVFLLAALIQAALRQDVTIALRAALISLPLAICACLAAVTLVELALAATDDATRVVTSGTGGDSRRFFEALAGIVSPWAQHTTVMPGFLSLLGGLLTALLCIVVWIELILREAAVYPGPRLSAAVTRRDGLAAHRAPGAAKGWRPPPPPGSLPMRQGARLGRTTAQIEKSGDRHGA
jgi:hypothetical protein